MKTSGRIQDDLYARAAGCFIGLAVGSAVESLAAGFDYHESGDVRNLAEVIDELLPEPCHPSASTAEALILAQSIAGAGGIDPLDFCLRLKAKLLNNAPDADAQTLSVLEKIAAGRDWEQAAFEVQVKDPGRAGGSPLVRSIPVALFHRSPGMILIEDSRLVSRITHPHAECQWSCAFASLIIAELLAGSATLQAVDVSLGVCGHRGDVPPQILFRSKEAAMSNVARNLHSGASALDSLSCSIWALAQHSSFEESLMAVLSLGGDIRPSGALTGALAGAAHGISSIDETWTKKVDPDGFLAELAVSMVDVS